MTYRRHTLPEIKAMLQARIVELCAALLPTGKHYATGGYWLAKNPHRDDRKPSLVVYTTKRVAGAWKDMGAEEFRGDVILLVQFVERLKDTGEALKWARNWLGLDRIDPDTLERIKIREVQKQQKKAEDSERKLQKDRGRAFALWLNCAKGWHDGTAHYLREARGADMALLPKWPGAVRFSPAQPYSALAVRDGRDAIIRPAPEFPCIVTMLTDRNNVNGAVHRTYLKTDCSDKAELGQDAKGHDYSPRICWPSYSGFMGRIWNGDGDVPLFEACKHGLVTDLVICEGLEDAVSIAISDPSKRVWMAVSLSNLAHAYVDLPAIGDVLVWADNDWGKPQAMRALGAAVAALRIRAPSKRIDVVRAPGAAKDANDLLKMGA